MMNKILFSIMVLLVACLGQDNLQIVTDATVPPFSFSRNEDIVGFDADFLRTIAQVVGFQYDLTSVTWSLIFEQVQGNAVDLAISGITINDVRKETYDFSVPYFISTHKILTKAGTAITSAVDLANKTVAVKNGTTGAAAVDKLAENDDSISITRFVTSEEAEQALINGEVDAFVDDNAGLEYYANNNPGFVVIEDPNSFEKEFYGLMFPKGSQLKARFDAAITAILNSEDYTRIYNEWFGTTPNVEALLTAGNPKTQEGQPLKIAIFPGLAPFSFLKYNELVGFDDAFEFLRDNQFDGFDIDFLKIISKVGGFDYELIPGSWDGIFAEVKSNAVDLAISGITINDLRKETYDFSVPYFVSTHKILAKEGTNITSAANLTNKTVAVMNGTTGAAAVDRLFESDNSINIVRFPTSEEALQALSNGEADAYVNDNALLEYYANNHPGFVVIEDPETFEMTFYGLMFPKGSQFKTRFDAAITTAFRNGSHFEAIEGIYNEWLGTTPNVEALLTEGNHNPDDQILLIAIEAWAAPWDFLENGEFVGFEIDFLKSLVATAGFEYELVPTVWRETYAEVAYKAVDLAIDDILIWGEDEFIDFSVPYFASVNKILAKEGTDITSAEDLTNKTIAVLSFSTAEDAVDELFENDTSVIIKRYATTEEALQVLINGEADAYVNDNSVLEYYANNNPGFVVIGDPDSFKVEYIGLIFPKGSPLKASFNAAITTLLTNGNYSQIYNDWFGTAPDIESLLTAGNSSEVSPNQP